ncbi:hypothetical protein [Fundicoccus culcitae]|uniref:Uncharacterized protein n=1 Tax=Fundicoccus culcitae TaxID=2969821 RepID=A0ABY5P5I8_9LACT|nr:hypothetical protein [Fundicoccus culcitae]UUX33693.1 hypothetical protein NRE15_12420 [Fundicoccus culcitae]
MLILSNNTVKQPYFMRSLASIFIPAWLKQVNIKHMWAVLDKVSI